MKSWKNIFLCIESIIIIVLVIICLLLNNHNCECPQEKCPDTNVVIPNNDNSNNENEETENETNETVKYNIRYGKYNNTYSHNAGKMDNGSYLILKEDNTFEFSVNHCWGYVTYNGNFEVNEKSSIISLILNEDDRVHTETNSIELYIYSEEEILLITQFNSCHSFGDTYTVDEES